MCHDALPVEMSAREGVSSRASASGGGGADGKNTHHFLVVWIIDLFDQWELLWAELLQESGHLCKLK